MSMTGYTVVSTWTVPHVTWTLTVSAFRAILCCKNPIVKTTVSGDPNEKGCKQGLFLQQMHARVLLGTDARNQKGHFDGCTQRTFGQRMCARYGANSGCTLPISRMHATPLISQMPDLHARWMEGREILEWLRGGGAMRLRFWNKHQIISLLLKQLASYRSVLANGIRYYCLN